MLQYLIILKVLKKLQHLHPILFQLKYSLKSTKILQKLAEEFAQRLPIVRVRWLQFLHHVDATDILIRRKLFRIRLVKAGKNRRRHSKLHEVNHHEDQWVAGNGHIASVIDVVMVRPQLHHESERLQAPVHLKVAEIISFNWNLFQFEFLTLRVTIEQMSIANSHTIIEVQVHFVFVSMITEPQYRNFCLYQRELLEFT